MTRKLPPPPGLSRRKPVKDQRKCFYIFCEGAVTEPVYLSDLYRSISRPIFQLKTFGGCGTPPGIVLKCKKLKSTLRANKMLGKNDQFWAVFDVDEHLDIKQAMEEARVSDVRVAVSNPCIEIWGIFHGKLQGAPLTHHAAQKQLAKEFPPYHHDKHPIFDWPQFGQKLEDALKNTRLARAARASEGCQFPDDNPSTGFDLLVQEMLNNTDKKA